LLLNGVKKAMRLSIRPIENNLERSLLEIIQHELLSNESLALTFLSKIYYYKIHLIYGRSICNEEMSEKASERLIHYWMLNEEKITEHSRLYKNCINEVLASELFFYQKIDQEKFIGLLKKITPVVEIEILQLRVQWETLFFLSECYANSFVSNREHMIQLENIMNNYGSFMDSFWQKYICYHLMVYKFINRDYQGTLIYGNKLITFLKDYSLNYMQDYGRVIMLIAHAELGHTDVLDYMIRNTRRYFKVRNQYGLSQSVVFRFVKNIVNTIEKNKKEQLYIKMLSFITELSRKETTLTFQFIPLQLWLQGKVRNKPEGKKVKIAVSL
jgi:hypothetical protein